MGSRPLSVASTWSSRLEISVSGVLQVPSSGPLAPDADRLSVEEHQIPAVVAEYLHYPAALCQVLVVLLQESPDVGGLGEAPPILPATRTHDDRLRAHPVLQEPPLRGVKGHEKFPSSVRRRRKLDDGTPREEQGGGPDIRRGPPRSGRCPGR